MDVVALGELLIDFAGALCASRRGAIPAMPSMAEVKNFQARVPKLIGN